MSYDVHIRNNETGEVRVCPDELEWFDEDGHSLEFWWAEGNMSCDCNRALLFHNGGGRSELDWEDAECGEGGYTVVGIFLEDGTKVYEDDV